MSNPKRAAIPKDDTKPEERFIWVKKQKLDEQKGLTPAELERLEAERRERNRIEVEKLERQRLKWEAEKEQKQLEKESIQFGREKELLGDWQEKERRFHLGQALARADLRIKAGRGTIFDWLIINTAQDADLNIINIADPIDLMREESFDDQLVHELEEHRELEKDSHSLCYIDALLSYIHEEELERSEVKDESHQIEVVKDEIKAVLEGKSVADLTKLERSVKAKLEGPGPIDTEYWQGLLVHLDRFRRRALVRETNSILIDRRKGQLGELAVLFTLEDRRLGGVTPIIGPHDLIAPTPSPVHSDSPEDHLDQSPESLQLYRAESLRKVHRDELPFNTEAEDLVNTSQTAEGLIKPRYFNRVRTSYEWNKYNQTHYDTDNPPPKSVQGYRFNIFYPQLASSAKAPSYKLEADPTSPDMKIIRFRAGQPYEDLLFRIEGDDWDMSHRQGFKCVFEGGVLRLHFWFKSQRYRR